MAKTLHATLAALLTVSALVACTSPTAEKKDGESVVVVNGGPPGPNAPRAADGRATDGQTGPGSLQTRLLAEVGDRVFFETDKAELRPEARQLLDKQAAWLSRYSSARLIIEGHADERGTREYNLALGERRAAAVREYLAAIGVGAQRLRTISYGKERPAVVGSVETAWAQNRRAVSVVE